MENQQNTSQNQTTNTDNLPNQGLLNPDVRFTEQKDVSGSLTSKPIEDVSLEDQAKFKQEFKGEIPSNNS